MHLSSPPSLNARGGGKEVIITSPSVLTLHPAEATLIFLSFPGSELDRVSFFWPNPAAYRHVFPIR